MDKLNQNNATTAIEINFYDVFQQAPLGIMILDQEQVIYAWNQWLVDITRIERQSAITHKLSDLYPETNNERFNWALEQAIVNKSQQMLSHTLNDFLIPLEVHYEDNPQLTHMPQQIHLAPIGFKDKKLAMVSITDVTENVIRSETLTQMADKLEEISVKDQLTGAFNRHYLQQWLTQQIKYLDRYHNPQSFLLLDIDHFKKINDNFGHIFGDVILKEFAGVVSQLLRDSDLLIRYGGEEFLIILVHADKHMAHMIAERIRATIEKNAFPKLKSGAITCSIGLSSWTKNKGEFDGPRLLKAADDALYHAKRNGRNQIAADPSQGDMK